MSAKDIFGGSTRWAYYRAEYHLTTLVGGIPKHPDTIRGWLKSRLELGDVELMALADRTIAEMGLTPEQMTPERIDAVVDSVYAAQEAKGNGFKVHQGELVYEGRCIKGAIKEAMNVVYPGTAKWPGHPGKTIRKGLMSYGVERVEVVETYIPLGRTEPDRANEQRIKHVSGPAGKRSTITVVDVVEDVKIAFTVGVLDDCIAPQLWREIWEYIELGGMWADRARGDGRGQLLSWQRVE